MIVTITNPYGLIKGQLKKWKKIGVISCNTCARICETGGKDAVEKLVTRLRADGFEVVDEDVIPMTCNLDMAEKGDYQGDYLIILGCDSGFATFEALYPNKRIVNGNKTVGLGSRDRNGNIFITEKL